MTEIIKHEHVKEAVRQTVQSGSDIHQKIKTLTLKALAEHQLDKQTIKSIAESVSEGINEGLLLQSDQAREIFGHAASALDEALAIAVEASKLAIEEASSRVNEYSHHDLDNATQDIKDLEDMFLETLEKMVNSSQIINDIVGDFVNHVRINGTSVGKQTAKALEALKPLTRLGKEAVVSSTVSATITLAQIGSGILSGIAESLQSPKTK
jgi:hypothetical protein